MRKPVITDKTRGYDGVYVPDHPKSNNRGYVREHILIAEKALGKLLPPKAHVHHYTPDQLVICQDAAYHYLLHRRQVAYEACGHASWRKCWVCQEYDDPKNLRIYKSSSVCHLDCASLRRRTNYAKKGE